MMSAWPAGMSASKFPEQPLLNPAAGQLGFLEVVVQRLNSPACEAFCAYPVEPFV